MSLAHLHVQPCPCSRCRVAANYRRLLATVAPGPVADPVQPVAAQQVGMLPETESPYLDVMVHT